MAYARLCGSICAVLAICLMVASMHAGREVLQAQDFRIDSGYTEAKLSHGNTAYSISRPNDLANPKDASTIVIIHGATLGSIAYHGYTSTLVNAGYTVVLYDQYGRGYSDRPDFLLSIELMSTQLLELINHLKIEKVYLFGISFGGAIAAHFAATYTDRVQAISYQVPVVTEVKLSPTIIATRLPVIGRLLGRFFGIPAIIARGESIDDHSEESRRIVHHFVSQFNVIGTE